MILFLCCAAFVGNKRWMDGWMDGWIKIGIVTCNGNEYDNLMITGNELIKRQLSITRRCVFE